jgi:SET domain-containing protein
MPSEKDLIDREFPEFFRSLGLIYRERSEVRESLVSGYDWSHSPYALDNQSEFTELTAKYGQKLRQGYLAPLHLRYLSQDLGWGVFAGADLASGDLLGEYAGVIQALTDAAAEDTVDGHYLSDYSWNYPDELPDGTAFEVNAFREGNLLRFVNHSPVPNSTVDHTLLDGLFVTFFRVIHRIPTGSQVFVDYGEEYWSGGFRTLVQL